MGLRTGQEFLASGPALAAFAKIDKVEVNGSIDWEAPSIDGLPLRIPKGTAQNLRLAFKGAPGNPNVTGRVSLHALAMSGLEISHRVNLPFVVGASSSTIRIPLDVNLPAVGGAITLSDYDQKVLLQADLMRFLLKGTLVVDLANPLDGSRLDLPAKGFALELANTIALTPWLAGTKPGFAKLGVGLSNSKPASIGRKSGEGQFEITTDLLTLAEPVFRMGEAATARRASLRLESAGKAQLSYGLADKKLVTDRLKFEAKDIVIRMLDPGGSVDIGETLVSEPELTIKRCLMDIDREKDVNVALIEQLSLNGTTYSKSRTKKTETAYGGTQASPFAIEKAVGINEFNDTSITVRGIDAHSVRFALKDAFLTIGESLVLQNAGIAISANRIQSIDEVLKNADGTDQMDENGKVRRERRTYLSKLVVRAGGRLRESEFSDNMQLDVPPSVSGLEIEANGRSDELDASGGFTISPFSGRFQSDLELPFSCKDGQKRYAPVEARFTTGGGSLGLKTQKGKTAVEGPLIGLSMIYKSDTARECDGRSEKKVLSPRQEWWTWGICPTWREPFRKCKWSTVIPEISIGYHFRYGFYHLLGHAAITAPIMTIKDSQTKFCFAPPVILSPVEVAMGISPQVEFSGARPGDLEKVLNGIIHASLTIMETTVLTGFANGGLMFLSDIISTPTGAMLSCALLRKDIEL
jgi:hypothetical protein